MRSRCLAFLLGCALALAAPWGAARATSLVPMDLDRLADLAELVFTGTAVHDEVVLSRDGRSTFTYVTFRVDDTLKGQVQGRELTLRFHGGAIGDEAVVVPGMPTFARGEEVLLFVRGNDQFVCPVVGWRQGLYRFAREARSGRKILVDSAGAPLLGIEHGAWRRGSPQELDGGEPEGGVLVGEEGVVITPAGWRPPGAGEPRGIPDAAQVLQTLRSHLQRRAGAAGSTPGRRVRSADPRDVPDSLHGGLAVPGRTP